MAKLATIIWFGCLADWCTASEIVFQKQLTNGGTLIGIREDITSSKESQTIIKKARSELQNLPGMFDKPPSVFLYTLEKTDPQDVSKRQPVWKKSYPRIIMVLGGTDGQCGFIFFDATVEGEHFAVVYESSGSTMVDIGANGRVVDSTTLRGAFDWPIAKGIRLIGSLTNNTLAIEMSNTDRSQSRWMWKDNKWVLVPTSEKRGLPKDSFLGGQPLKGEK